MYKAKTVAEPFTISEFIAGYEHAVQSVKDAYRCEEVARSACKQISSNHLMPYTLFRDDIERVLRDMRISAWRDISTRSGFRAFADSQTIAEFEHALEKNPPELSVDTVRLTLKDWSNNSEQLFYQSIRNLYDQLPHRYKTHTNAKGGFPKKIIRCYSACATWTGSLRLEHGIQSFITDLERAIVRINGGVFKDGTLYSKVNDAIDKGEPYEDKHIRIVAYLNGNIHLSFLDMKLHEKLNSLLAQTGENEIVHKQAAAA